MSRRSLFETGTELTSKLRMLSSARPFAVATVDKSDALSADDGGSLASHVNDIPMIIKSCVEGSGVGRCDGREEGCGLGRCEGCGVGLGEGCVEGVEVQLDEKRLSVKLPLSTKVPRRLQEQVTASGE